MNNAPVNNPKPLTFTEWKKAMNADGWFKTNPNYLRAVAVVFNAYLSHRDGQLTDRGLKAAINWGFNLDHSAALHEVRRAEARNFYKKSPAIA